MYKKGSYIKICVVRMTPFVLDYKSGLNNAMNIPHTFFEPINEGVL